jgi:hypothetical protein
MWAPDAAEKDGKYFLYFPVKDKEDVFHIGAAVGDNPAGPFKAQAEPIKNSFSMDPAVFKDDDGKYYMYFGGLWGGQLQHWKTGKWDPKDDAQPADDKPALLPKIARLDASMGAFRQTMTVQAQVVENVQSDTEALADIVARSQGAEGSLQAQQATNQLLALAAKQQFQLQHMMAAQFRSEAIEQTRRATQAAEARAATKKFLGSGSAYTPE